jgi:hypothetical protein
LHAIVERNCALRLDWAERLSKVIYVAIRNIAAVRRASESRRAETDDMIAPGSIVAHIRGMTTASKSSAPKTGRGLLTPV